ncbi:MAG: IS1595 family transposase [Prevotellaceae bacterium]|nr:IS1595 family transposase [Prevotellaceae bacterium]
MRELRERDVHVCPKCGHKEWYLKRDKLCYECKKCHHRKSIRKGTVMEKLRSLFRYWFVTMHLLIATKNGTFSALELQRQLGHTLPTSMGDAPVCAASWAKGTEHTLKGNVGDRRRLLSTGEGRREGRRPQKRGAGSQSKTKVLVMAESKSVENPKPGKKEKKVNHIKMVVIPDAKADTIDGVVKVKVDKDSSVVGDGTKCAFISGHLQGVFGRKINAEDRARFFHGPHIAISNAKTRLAGIYHGIKPEYLQEYLNEFCYKFNRRYFGERQFDRLLSAAVGYVTDFKHRVYNKRLGFA